MIDGNLRNLSTTQRWLREPLLQFLFAGLLLFAAYRTLHPSPDPRDQPRRIELTADDVRQLSVAWLAQGRPPPTAEQMQNLIGAKVREEVLYREALALGLDKNDTIVKRRMAQKMEFLAEEVSDAREPTTDELAAWFEENAERFGLPGRVTFRHLYFSPDRRGVHTRDDAVEALRQLAGQPETSPAAKALGDRFMFQAYLSDRSPEQLAKELGPAFALAIFTLEPGSWQGPIESGYGWHLVFVESSTPGRMPAFEEVEPDVRNAWQSDRRAAAWRKVYDEMRSKYEIVLPATPMANERNDATSPTGAPR